MLFCANAVGVVAQDSVPNWPRDPRVIVKLAPLHLINGYYDQSVRLSLEYLFLDNYSVQMEYGYYPHDFNSGEVEGFYLGSQIRVTDYESDRKRIGLSFGLAYKQQEINTSDTTWTGTATVLYKKDYRIEKNVLVLSLQFVDIGSVLRSNRLWLDFAVGISGRYKEAVCYGLTEEEEHNREFGESMVLGATKECYVGWKFSLEINFKVGYAIW